MLRNSHGPDLGLAVPYYQAPGRNVGLFAEFVNCEVGICGFIALTAGDLARISPQLRGNARLGASPFRNHFISAAALRSVEHRGGLDAYLLKAGDEELSLKAKRLKREIAKVQGAQA